jgi:hypothetical protein
MRTVDEVYKRKLSAVFDVTHLGSNAMLISSHSHLYSCRIDHFKTVVSTDE